MTPLTESKASVAATVAGCFTACCSDLHFLSASTVKCQSFYHRALGQPQRPMDQLIKGVSVRVRCWRDEKSADNTLDLWFTFTSSIRQFSLSEPFLLHHLTVFSSGLMAPAGRLVALALYLMLPTHVRLTAVDGNTFTFWGLLPGHSDESGAVVKCRPVA